VIKLRLLVLSKKK